MGGGALLGVLKYGIFAKLLNPESFGIYSLVLTTYVYILYAGGLGLNEAVIKIGSHAHGKGQSEQVARLRDISLVYGGIATLVCGIIYILAIKIFISDKTLANSLALAGGLALAALEFNLVDATFRASQKILLFSGMLFAKGLAVVILGMYLVPEYGANGVIVGEIIAFIGVFTLALIFCGNRFHLSRLSDSRALFINAVRNGFPLVISMFIRNISMSMDRWVMAASIGLLALGKYTFAMILYLVALTGTGFLTNILGPRWLAGYAKNQNAKQLFHQIKKVVLHILILAIISAGPFFFLIKFALQYFYPAYAGDDTLIATALIYVGVTILMCTYLFDWLFIALSAEKKLLRIALYTLSITAILICLVHTLNGTIEFYAGVFLLCRFFTALLYIKSIAMLLECHSQN